MANYVKWITLLAMCKSNSCERDQNCSYQKSRRAILAKNCIAAANEITNYSSEAFVKWYAGDEEDAKRYIKSEIELMVSITPSRKSKSIAAVCAECQAIRKKKRGLEYKLAT